MRWSWGGGGGEEAGGLICHCGKFRSWGWGVDYYCSYRLLCCLSFRCEGLGVGLVVMAWFENLQGYTVIATMQRSHRSLGLTPLVLA